MVYRFRFEIKNGPQTKRGYIIAHTYVEAIEFITEVWSAWELVEIALKEDEYIHLAACMGSVYSVPE